MNFWRLAPLALGSSVLLVGCHLDMWVQPKVKAQSENKFYADGQGTRPPVNGTVEFGKPRSDDAFYTGFENGRLVSEFPVEVDKEFLLKGKENFEVFCSHCHGAIGDGKGMIAQRGFELRRPVGDYHTDRLRDMPVGHFYDVITNGYGTMYPQGGRIRPYDRWSIVAYIRALQLSQNASADDLNAAAADLLETVPGSGAGELFLPKAGAPTTVPDPDELGEEVGRSGEATVPTEMGAIPDGDGDEEGSF